MDIIDNKVAVGKSAKEAHNTAKKKFPKETPLLAYTPTGEIEQDYF